MEIQAMGKVLVAVRIASIDDLYEVEKGRLSADRVRTEQVDDAVVDTGATLVSLPRTLIERLGLRRLRTRTARTAAGVFSFGIYGPVQLTIQDRECVVEAAELPDGCPVLIGQVPLELLDFVVDPVGHRLIGNPAHGGKHMIDLLYCCLE